MTEWEPIGPVDGLLVRLATWKSVSIAVLFLVVAFSLPLDALIPMQAAVAVRLLSSAYALVSLIGFAWGRFEAMSIPATKALELYGQVTRIRGRDFFGPIVTEAPARQVMVILSLDAIESRGFKYSLEYEITFERPLTSPLHLETLVAPVCYFGSARYACYRYSTPEHWRLTLDFAPVGEVQLAHMAPANRHDCIRELIRSALKTLRVYSAPGSQEHKGKNNNTELILVPLEQEPFDVPIVETRLPTGRVSVRATMGPSTHPLTYQHFRIASPLRTRALVVVCRSRCSIVAGHFIHAGECSRVDRRQLQQGQDSILSNVGAGWQTVAGYSWTADDNWIITPGDWVDIYFNSQTPAPGAATTPAGVQESR